MNRRKPNLQCLALLAITTAVGTVLHAGNEAESAAPRSNVQIEGGQSKAEEHLRKLAKSGKKKAQMELGEAYLIGRMGLKRDPKKAMTWLRQAACEDSKSKRKKQTPEPRAFLLLGRCYERKDYAEFLKLKQSLPRALEYYRLAEKNGYMPAAFDVAQALRKLKQPEAAAIYFKKAADYDIQPAQVAYGQVLLSGEGVKVDAPAAIPYLEKAAQSGSSDAQLMLADVYGGIYPGVIPDPEKMIDYLWQAAMTRSEAIARIGYCYQHGIGLPKDPSLAVRWYIRAANSDDPCPEATVALAGCLLKGIGIEKNEAKALELYLKASSIPGRPNIVFHNIGTCYAKGVGTKKDEGKAFVFFKQAADLGVPASMNAVGELYESGTAIDPKTDKKIKDFKLAFQWYEKAAKAKNPRGLYNLGRCYNEGIGVAQDKEKAQLLLKQGFEGGVKKPDAIPKKTAPPKKESTLKGF